MADRQHAAVAPPSRLTVASRSRTACLPRTHRGCLRCRIVHDLGDLHELNGWRDAVQAGHSLTQLLGGELLRRLFGVPDVEVDRSLLLIIEGEELKPQARHALKHTPGVLSHLGYP